MNNIPRQQLTKLIAKYGNVLCEDPVRCEELLKETCGGYPREVSLLIDALKEQVPIELLSSSNNLPRRTLQARLIKNLEETLYLKKEVAKWTVESWAIALGLLETPTVLQFFTPTDNQADEQRNRPLPLSPEQKEHLQEKSIQQPEAPPLIERKPLENIPPENQITAQELPLHFQSALSSTPKQSLLANRKIKMACTAGFVYGLMMILHMFFHQYNNIPLQNYSYNTWYVLTFHDANWTLIDFLGLPLLFFLPLIGWAAGSFSHDIYYLSALDIVLVFGLSFAIYSEKNNLFSISLFVYFCISQFLSPMLTSAGFIDRAGWLILFIVIGFLLIQGIQGTLMYGKLLKEK